MADREFRVFVAFASLSAALFVASGVRASAVNNQRETNTLVSGAATIGAASAMAGLIDAQIGSTIQPGVTAAMGQDRAGATDYLGSRGQSGLAAGGQAEGLGVWVRGSWSLLDNTETGGEYEGHISNIGIGVDYKVSDTVLVGVALGWEHMDIDTTFNRGTYEGSGYTVAPYIGVNLSDQLYVSASAGYSDIDYDFTRSLNGYTSGATSGKRKFATANATYTVDQEVHGVDGLRLSPLAGIFWVSEQQGVYTDSASTVVNGKTIELGRLSGGVNIGYGVGAFEDYGIKALEPFAKMVGEWDFKAGESVDLGNGRFSNVSEYGGVLGLGLNFTMLNNVSGTLEGSTSLFREDFSSYTVLGRVRGEF